MRMFLVLGNIHEVFKVEGQNISNLLSIRSEKNKKYTCLGMCKKKRCCLVPDIIVQLT